MTKKKQDVCSPIDTECLLLDMQSPDEEVRAGAVRSLCPCHAGWEVFERHVTVVFQGLRDRSHAVRVHALHVFDDAAQMRFAAEYEYRLQEVDEMLQKKRASRFRAKEAALEARRREEMRRFRRRRIAAGKAA